MKGVGGHQSHAFGKEEWLTPPWVLEAFGPFDLDPCAPVNPPWRTATTMLNINDDGLSVAWPRSSFVWMNPPYGYTAATWLDVLAQQGNGLALIYARTETAMFFDHVWSRASALLFLRGRLHFHHVDGSRAPVNCGAPSVLVGYGPEAVRRLSNRQDLGKLVVLPFDDGFGADT